MSEVRVVCAGDASAGWTCQVRVGSDAGATVHEVHVAPDLLRRLRPGADDPTQLVIDSFTFLLAREPRESILSAFDLPVIGRYFPEWEVEIAR